VVKWNSPYINHFLSPDSIVPDQTNPQSWNRYSYVNNNPVRYTDPSGHMMDQGDMGGGAGCSDPKYCRGGKPKSHEELKKIRELRKRKSNPSFATVTPMPTTTLPLYGSLPTFTPSPEFSLQQAPSATPITMPVPVSHPNINVDINWNQVDRFDTAIDGIGTGADVITIISVLAGQPEIAVGAQVVGKIDSVVGTIKGGYDLISKHDTSNLMSQELWRSAEATRLLWRGESNIPIVSIIGNSINLYRDLNPQITITWETP
jgi:hypothetical protein